MFQAAEIFKLDILFLRGKIPISFLSKNFIDEGNNATPISYETKDINVKYCFASNFQFKNGIIITEK